MIEVSEILQTIRMVSEQHFDIRTITMGISLLDCKKNTDRETAQAVYDKVTRVARDLVRVGGELESELGVPIVNKRISVTPVGMICGDDPVAIAMALDEAAGTVGVNFIGGYGALMHKGATRAEETLLDSMPEAFSKTARLCGSVNVGSTRSGINMDAVRKMGHVIKRTAELTADTDGFGCAKIVVFANAVEDNPFMAGRVPRRGRAGVRGQRGRERAGRGAARAAARCAASRSTWWPRRSSARPSRSPAWASWWRRRPPSGWACRSASWTCPSPPPPRAGDSVAYILQEMGLEMTGAPGTTAALAMLNDMVKKGGVMASSHVGGLSGAFIPVSEDIGMIEAAQARCLTIEKLEAMTCVCSVGLDMIAIPGDTSANAIAGIIADEAAIGMVNNKTTAVRVIPAPGKKAGDTVNFGGLFGFAPVMPVNGAKNDAFIERGGRIPAPLHSLKN